MDSDVLATLKILIIGESGVGKSRFIIVCFTRVFEYNRIIRLKYEVDSVRFFIYFLYGIQTLVVKISYLGKSNSY